MSRGASLNRVDAIEDVYQRRYGSFRRAVTALVGDADLAHDAVEEGFARAFRKRRQFRGDMLEAWIWRVGVRAALDLRRRRGLDALPEHDVSVVLDTDGRDPDLEAALVSPAAAAPARRLPALLRRPVLCADRRGVRDRRGHGGRDAWSAHDDLKLALTTTEVER